MENTTESETSRIPQSLTAIKNTEVLDDAKQIEVIQAVKNYNPELIHHCYAVGAWVWAEFQQRLSQEEVDFLKNLGFRWNPVRRVWQLQKPLVFEASGIVKSLTDRQEFHS